MRLTDSWPRYVTRDSSWLITQAVLLEARWANETDRFEINEVLDRFRKAISLAPQYVIS